MRAYLLSHLVTVFGVIAAIVLMLRVQARRTSQSVLAWTLGFVFVPFVAIPLFLMLGSRKFPARAKGPSDTEAWTDEETAAAPALARVLRGSGVAPPRAGTSFELLGDGETAYRRLLELVAKAERSIDVTIFILGDDATGRAVVDALAERAAKGVRVRVILDAVGCAVSARWVRERLEPKAQVRLFMPLAHSPIRGRTNLRSHRKLVVIDRGVVFGGGMNFADEYMGPEPREGKDARWRDVAAIARGPVALDAEAMFESDWAYAGGAPVDHAAEPAPSPAGDEIVQMVPSGPDFDTDTVYDLWLTAIGRATERVGLVTPYYVPDDDLQHALVLAVRRGVRVDVVVPAVSNHRLADVARRNLLRELSAAGVVLHYYERGMVHAKAMVVDDAFAYVGSPNFDMRSLFLNYESALCVYSPGAIASIRAYVDGLAAESTLAAPASREHRIIEQVARLLAPEL